MIILGMEFATARDGRVAFSAALLESVEGGAGGVVREDESASGD